jgi:hypothetical protein
MAGGPLCYLALESWIAGSQVVSKSWDESTSAQPSVAANCGYSDVGRKAPGGDFEKARTGGSAPVSSQEQGERRIAVVQTHTYFGGSLQDARTGIM